MIRAISAWATAAMCGIAATALVQLMIAFLPVADLRAVHHPGADSTALRAGAWALLIACGCFGCTSCAVWAARARANLVVFGLRSRRIVNSVGRAPELRRRMAVLTWLLRCTLLAGGVALLLAELAGRDNAAEIADVRRQARAGHPVDDALAAHLFGRQLVLHLPAAALFVLAAALALLIIARVTSAQYGRVARLRARDEAFAAVGGTIRA